jgi:hypothetical protein
MGPQKSTWRAIRGRLQGEKCRHKARFEHKNLLEYCPGPTTFRSQHRCKARDETGEIEGSPGKSRTG